MRWSERTPSTFTELYKKLRFLHAERQKRLEAVRSISESNRLILPLFLCCDCCRYPTSQSAQKWRHLHLLQCKLIFLFNKAVVFFVLVLFILLAIIELYCLMSHWDTFPLFMLMPTNEFQRPECSLLVVHFNYVSPPVRGSVLVSLLLIEWHLPLSRFAVSLFCPFLMAELRNLWVCAVLGFFFSG